MAYDYETLGIEYDKGVLTATINNPPMNVMTPPLYMDLVGFTSEVEQDESVKVVVFQSADPDFFIAHFDVEAILEFPIDTPAEKSLEFSDFHLMCERVRTMPKATIVKMAGRAGGGGNEFASSCDMRFGLKGKTVINQMEVALGILPGGTGTQRLPRLVGRGRAMEICLGSDDIDAETAAQWGYLNRVFDSANELDGFVDSLSKRIACWPAEAIALCKASINNAEMPLSDGLLEEAFLFQQTLRTKGAQQNMRKAMAMGLQTREGELRMGELCYDFAQAANDED
ncbi:MAG: enoyl-CoA hydratase/isomerase family protein [Gammaproteobacteria bacterium]|jgi:enoyl-CoA hydratase/carnithine racemase|nr:enoyl-CoA hydratase/isomerase family protein [Gammaproteobacteria bacterium]MBT3870474.1 enoyl-CoA hydratase/isomerase family protein [Gammaproteobacteria bacterium]MBT4378822.1 enoyl-CoA hydratase/isomerase family protein [Gammaproteobacteria bacterium]MBT5196237.1 enoyl-CoA hydratase/isomerase family protein [Gammaproteobacteria bacterium]MBT5444981.1 enoyl-CoA hydratase/isomerase family protein [Gammaproteobacteria bacterium]